MIGLALILASTSSLAVSAEQSAPAYGVPIRNRHLRGTVAGNHLIYAYPWYGAPPYWGGVLPGYSPQEMPPYAPLPSDSPGAMLLSKYQLNQTPCVEPNLVVIFGLEKSIVCAYPFGSIAAGEYDIDLSDLTLFSRG